MADQKFIKDIFNTEANQVIIGDRREKTDAHSGEPISLAGSISAKEMGIHAKQESLKQILDDQRKK